MEKLDRAIGKCTSLVGGVSFVIMVSVIVLNVFARLFFLRSFAWTEEIAYLFLNWAVFMGICVLFRGNGLVAIDVLVNALPAFPKKLVALFVYLLLTFTNVGLTLWSLRIALSAWTGRASAILHIPYFYYYIAITIAGIILTGYSIMFFIKVLKNEDIEETALEERA